MHAATGRSRLELQQFIEAQRADYRRTLPGKINQVESLWHAARQADQGAWSALERLAHNLHGTAGTYGFADLSRASHVLELAVRALMEAGSPPTPAQQQHITDAIGAVRLSLPAA